MNGLLQKIQSGRSTAPPRLMIYGTEGIGKSTLAARAPQPIFIQTEDGLGEIDCHKFPLATTFDEVVAALGGAARRITTFNRSSSTRSTGSNG
jgi:hypothetical protein